jgi:hypothetical protein
LLVLMANTLNRTAAEIITIHLLNNFFIAVNFIYSM